MHQSISVSGNSWLIGTFLAKAMKRFPSTTFYDHSDGLLRFRSDECALAGKGLLDNSQDMRQACSKALTAAEVDFHFQDSGDTVIVDVRGSAGTRTHTLRGSLSFGRIDRFIGEILRFV